ncbi:MmgE/PrpD family protein [Devosia rhizoryzae]|uniref:MmgE/PrpD family protein n=1 Tax=Devosia rhizoryzae TaxID=2774137 RepID=A0ABX7C5G4_9HYPH|nr:MmgE/PrpD family protein [Devosia rhizoryzae]QQR38469.1 MmgE/PrpD family protein [Devosia rhizoryzae]
MAISDREWVSRHVALASSAISRADVEVIGRLVADTIAIATYARRHRLGGTAFDETGLAMGSHDSAVWGSALTASPLDAAFLNGSAAEALDFQEVLLNGRNNGHAAVVIVPAVFALAQQRGATSEEVLQALRVGFAANIGLGEALGRAHRTDGRGFRTTSLTATPAAALACAVLISRDVDIALAATGIAACTIPAGLLTAMSPSEGSYSVDKDLSVGFSARHTLHAALLAEGGAKGPSAPITGDKGWLASFASGSADRTYLEIAPESRELSAYSVKLFPANFGCQAAIRSAMELGKEIGAERIERLEVKVKTSSSQSLSTRAIGNHLAARFSLPFAVASACVRERSVLADFEGSAVEDASVLSFMDRVTVEGDAALEARHLDLGIFPARVFAWGAEGLLGEKSYDGPFDGMSDSEAHAVFAAKVEALVDDSVARDLLAYASEPAAPEALRRLF